MMGFKIGGGDANGRRNRSMKQYSRTLGVEMTTGRGGDGFRYPIPIPA